MIWVQDRTRECCVSVRYRPNNVPKTVEILGAFSAAAPAGHPMGPAHQAKGLRIGAEIVRIDLRPDFFLYLRFTTKVGVDR